VETPRRYATDGTWNHVWIVILAEADEAGEIDWTMSVDATITRAHQYPTNTPTRSGHRGAFDARQ